MRTLWASLHWHVISCNIIVVVCGTVLTTNFVVIRGKATRWGIASAGNISADYVTALKLLPEEEHQVVAVAARKLEASKAFAQKFDIPRLYGSYEELATDENVDIVYVGAIHPAHHALCSLMLNAGKHVLCEKPLGLNLRQVKEMTGLARKKGVLLAEGFWSLHFPAWHQMREELAAGTVGQLKMVIVNFGQDIISQGVSRLVDRSLGGGALLDLGCYAVMAANDIFKEKPEKIIASGLMLDTGVDGAAFITLHYSGGRVAQLNIHAGAWLSNNMLISGTTGTMEMPSFWNASQLITPEKTYNFPLPEHAEKFMYIRSEGFIYEAQAIRESLLKDETENPRITLNDSEVIMEIMDDVRKQLGVVYDVD